MILTRDEDIVALCGSLNRVAVLGIKTEAQAEQPAFAVPRYLQANGVTIVPVPVYYPEVTSILGQPIYRTMSAIPGSLDAVDVFRRPQDIDAHVDDILAKRPAVIWFQLGIRNDAAAQRCSDAGLTVVQDRCLKIEYARWSLSRK
jgi:predicted CoA-binding protein